MSHSSCTPSTAHKEVDIIESVEDYQSFFEPGENKTKLVEGHNLYIDSTKLQAMKSKTKKDTLKMVRELASYFFKPSYLASHSATGQKSTKLGLPLEIMTPIRDYMSRNYKFADTNVVINRKCLDTWRQQKTMTKKI